MPPRLLLPVQTTTRGILCSHGQLLSHQTQVDYIYKNLQHMIDGFSGVLQKKCIICLISRDIETISVR